MAQISAVGSGTYTINYDMVAAPTFSPAAGTYSTDQSVTITTATSGATIYYTVDGSTPIASSSQYTSPISVAGNGTTKTIKAIAVKSGLANSAVASGTWVIGNDTSGINIQPTVLSTFPDNNAISINPISGRISVVFDKAMNTSLTPSLTTEGDSNGTYNNIPNTGTTFTWINSTTLQIDLSWIYFPENTKLRWTLSASGLRSVGGIQISADVQRIFTTSTKPSTIPLIRTGITACYDSAGTVIACSGTKQDGELQIGAVRSYTGPTQHSTYTSDYTTKDNNTKLIWKTCSEGQSTSTCTGTASTMIWENAINACASLNTANGGNGYAGRKGWRLPSSYELESLVDYGRVNPAIDTTYFPNTIGPYYWSSSTYISGTNYAWLVYFHYGYPVNLYKTSNYFVRCVLTGP